MAIVKIAQKIRQISDVKSIGHIETGVKTNIKSGGNMAELCYA